MDLFFLNGWKFSYLFAGGISFCCSCKSTFRKIATPTISKACVKIRYSNSMTTFSAKDQVKGDRILHHSVPEIFSH
jgi:hypothetical protein